MIDRLLVSPFFLLLLLLLFYPQRLSARVCLRRAMNVVGVVFYIPSSILFYFLHAGYIDVVAALTLVYLEWIVYRTSARMIEHLHLHGCLSPLHCAIL